MYIFKDPIGKVCQAQISVFLKEQPGEYRLVGIW